jgi:uncharacterized protein YpmS
MNILKSLKSGSFILVILVMLLFTTMACSMGGINVNKNNATVDITFTQDQMNKLIKNSYGEVTISNDRIFKNVTSVEMHDGFMRVFGDYVKTDGTTVPGSFDMSFGTDNGELKIQIIAIDASGASLDDPRIKEANQTLSDELSKSFRESNGEVLFKEASVSESGLKLKMEVKLSK